MKSVDLFINGQFIPSRAKQTKAILNPATQEKIGETPYSTPDEMNAALEAAQKAYPAWRDTPVPERARVMLRYQALLKEHQDEIAKIVALENGKVFADAQGDVWRGIEVVEHACNISSLLMGETVENVARRIDTYSVVQSLGVCAGITPFNFPAMIPLWMFPLSIACGNTFVLKPSEQVPLTSLKLAELFKKAGAPDGVLNVVHGGREQVDTLLSDPRVKAVSFVGSVPVGRYIYETAAKHGKRVQALAGAKNHMLVMPDADKDTVIKSLAGASCGAAGQRCMAISVAVFVGEAQKWIDDVAAGVKQLKVGSWDDPQADLGPLVNGAAKERVLSLIAAGKKEGAKCLVDGSTVTSEKNPQGNFVGPTVFDNVKASMSIYKEEIFGPVLCCVRAETFDEALKFINENPCGNGTSIFTRSGLYARRYQHEVDVGQVGINIPIPVPMPFFSFTGWKASFYGDLHAYGKEAIRFYTQTKTITARWPEGPESGGINTTIRLS